MNAPAAIPEAEPVVPDSVPEYDARWQRIVDCVALKRPDRMPVKRG